MARTLLAILLVLLLALPTSQAGLFSDPPVEVTPAPSRVGDLLSYEHHQPNLVRPEPPEVQMSTTGGPQVGPDGGTSTVTAETETRDHWMMTVLLQVEGTGEARDRYNLSRPVVHYRSEHWIEGHLIEASRCHALQGGVDAVRKDVLYNLGYGRGGGAGSPTEGHERRANLTVDFPRECMYASLVPARAYAEGEALPLGTLLPGWRDTPAGAVVSSPAEATEFHGRPALEFRFDDVPTGLPFEPTRSLRVTLADGLPGVVRVVTEAASGDQRVELVGYEPGEGAELRVDPSARLPASNPRAQTRAYEPLVVDDEAWELAYPFAEAMAALRSDPSIRADAWLSARPDAYVQLAVYDRDHEEAVYPYPGVKTDGQWTIIFASGSEMYWASTTRLAPAHGTPVGAPAGTTGAAPLVVNRDDEPWVGMEMPRPADGAPVVASHTLAELGASAGVGPGDVALFTYEVGYVLESEADVRLTVSDVPANTQDEHVDGREVDLDPLVGGLDGIWEATWTRWQQPLLSPGGGNVRMDAAPTSALALLAGPLPGLGLAGGAAAATGLALLMLALKFGLVPFFTRLARDRLLDNPVRARLLERVRAEPGIRQNELVEYAGVGEGATRRHLDQLVKHRFLVRVEEDSLVAYSVAGEVPADLARRAALLRSDPARRVHDLYAREPHLSLRAAAQRLDLSAPRVHLVKKRLESAGLLPAPVEASVREAR